MDLAQVLLAHPRLYAALHRLVSGGKLAHIERALREDGLDGASRLKVLDLGCGPGTNAPLFTRARSWDYLGVDLNPDYVEYAASRLPGRFRQADITRLSDLGERFDIVLLNSVLHHLDDRGAEGAVACAAVHLQPKGVLLAIDMVTPTGALWGRALRRALVALDRGAFCRSEADLESLFRSHFEHVRIQPFALSLVGTRLWEMRLYACRRPIPC